MKRNKTLSLTALIAGSLFAGTALQAEDPAPPPKVANPRAGAGEAGDPHARGGEDMMARELGLNDEQKAKMKAASEETQKQGKALREDDTIKPEDKKVKVMELRKAHQAKVKEILTPEQYTKLQSYAEKHRPMRPQNEVILPGSDKAPKTE